MPFFGVREARREHRLRFGHGPIFGLWRRGDRNRFAGFGHDPFFGFRAGQITGVVIRTQANLGLGARRTHGFWIGSWTWANFWTSGAERKHGV